MQVQVFIIIIIIIQVTWKLLIAFHRILQDGDATVVTKSMKHASLIGMPDFTMLFKNLLFVNTFKMINNFLVYIQMKSVVPMLKLVIHLMDNLLVKRKHFSFICWYLLISLLILLISREIWQDNCQQTTIPQQKQIRAWKL